MSNVWRRRKARSRCRLLSQSCSGSVYPPAAGIGGNALVLGSRRRVGRYLGSTFWMFDLGWSDWNCALGVGVYRYCK